MACVSTDLIRQLCSQQGQAASSVHEWAKAGDGLHQPSGVCQGRSWAVPCFLVWSQSAPLGGPALWAAGACIWLPGGNFAARFPGCAGHVRAGRF